MSYLNGGLDWTRYSVFERIPEYGPGAIKPTNGLCFVLKPFLDPHAKVAFRAYAESVKDENPQLADDILAVIK